MACAFMVYVVFSDMGQIKLGEADEEPWVQNRIMGSNAFLWWYRGKYFLLGCIEWAYYYQSPPFQLEPGSEEAVR